ncbi:MAG TPA: hypothetical protein VFT48_19720 [Pyrinomonadaceae bacterium]|nr:hypothetical protein [Pyrinomonadaceae bacterium]
MVNVSASIFSLSIEKTAKKRGYLKNQMLAHTLPKELHGGGKMKKGLVTIFCLLVLTLSSLPVGAQTRYSRRYDGRRYEQRWDRDRSFWDRHRDKLTTGIGVGAGAVIGGVAGGKKGALIGALLGGGGAALYTYKLRDNRRRRY